MDSYISELLATMELKGIHKQDIDFIKRRLLREQIITDNAETLNNALARIQKLESQLKIDWHKYPEEKPEKYKDYLITVKTENETFVNKDTWREGGEWDEYIDRYIIAWADITYPEPYKE